MDPGTTGDSGERKMASSTQGLNSLFNKVEKFDGKLDSDLSTWLRTFERCCTIAGKDDDLVKGQLLMLCLAGQALAVAEQLEEEKNAQQKFSEIKARLETVFTTVSTREAKMVEFENRIQRIGESEDEFMLQLGKLYRAANPDATDVDKAVKRRFMNGISNEVRHSIYIFCNDPYATTVTCQILLEHARKAKLHAQESGTKRDVLNTFSTNDQATNESSVNTNSILSAISNLTDRLDNFENNFNSERVNAIRGNRGFVNRRGNFNNRSRYNKRGFPNNTYSNSNNPKRCYKCGGLYHIARFCNSKN